MFTPNSIMSTLTVAVAKLSVNKMKMMAGIVYTKFYSVDTNGCGSNAYCKQAKMMVGYVNTKFYSVDTNGCISNAKCKQSKMMVGNVNTKFYSVDTNGCSRGNAVAQW